MEYLDGFVIGTIANVVFIPIHAFHVRMIEQHDRYFESMAIWN
jgi:hypothetical protein